MNGGDAEFWTIEIWDGDDQPTNTASDALCVDPEVFTDSNATQDFNDVYDLGESFVDANSNGEWDAGILTNCWSISRSYELGLNVSMTDDIRLRVTPANESVAESYDDGHSVLVKMKNMPDGAFSEYELKLFVPQAHGAELASEIVDVIGIQPGNDETYTFLFENTGNGDDTYSISISELPEKKFSVETWVKVDEPHSWGGIIGAMQDNGTYEKGWLLGFANSRFSFALNGKGGDDSLNYMTADQDFIPGQWYHLAATYDGTTMNLYVNGESAATSNSQSGVIQLSLIHI